MADINYISDFLTVVEGPRQTTGYIPCYLKAGGSANYRGTGDPAKYIAMGASGVTIGTGCDLGQTTIAQLREYGVKDEVLLGTLQPYIGLKKDAAIQKLHRSGGVKISPEQARGLDHAVHGGYLEKWVIPAYERDSRGVRFDALPKQAQAVIMSVCFQKGAGGVKRDWPKTWKYLTTQNWAAASQELRTGFVKYVGRRNTEGKLLGEIA